MIDFFINSTSTANEKFTRSHINAAELTACMSSPPPQLCSTKLGRETCRAKKVYPIVRELHSVEKTEDLEKHIYDLVCVFSRA